MLHISPEPCNFTGVQKEITKHKTQGIMKTDDLKKRIFSIKITGAQYLILTVIIDRVFHDMKYDTTDKVYRDKGWFILQMDSKEMAALRSLRKTLGIT